jgi:methanogenic corrinoid protein MtbC1
MYAALDTLRPHLREKRYKGKIIIGTVYGDIHDIGKNIVKFFLEGSGFKVIDLGRDVPAEKFLESVEKEKADILACQL